MTQALPNVLLRPCSVCGQAEAQRTQTRCAGCSAKRPCAKCGGARDTTHSWCSVCLRADRHARYWRNPELFRQRASEWEKRQSYAGTWKQRKKNGWTREMFAQAWEAQGGRCAACGVVMRTDRHHNDSVCADHDHRTGKARALICFRCNRQLGVYEASAERLALYLARHGATQ